MGAYPQMVRDIASVKEEADVLAARTVKHIAPEKRAEFEERVESVKNLRDVLDQNTAQGQSITSSLSDHINKAISLGTKHGGHAFKQFRPLWHHLRNRCELLGRRFDLYNSWTEEALEPTLWWMVECGELGDLQLLHEIERDVPETYKSAIPLIQFAIEQISKRSTLSIKDLCTFFDLSEDEIFSVDFSSALSRGQVSSERSYLIEDLEGIKQAIEKGHGQPYIAEFIEFKLRRLSAANATAVVNKVMHIVEQFLCVEEEVNFDLDEDAGESKDVSSVEAYAVAQIKDPPPDKLFWVRERYTVQAGLQHTPPEGFEVQALQVPEGEGPLEFDIIVYAEDMKIEPDWKQTYVFNRKAEAQLQEFYLIPTKPGDKIIRVEFLYQQHWLATIRFQVTVAEHPL